jgi:lipopolysaccharide/colanic/teichoic acid biosynthesis glycosyltransferase
MGMEYEAQTICICFVVVSVVVVVLLILFLIIKLKDKTPRLFKTQTLLATQKVTVEKMAVELRYSESSCGI